MKATTQGWRCALCVRRCIEKGVKVRRARKTRFACKVCRKFLCCPTCWHIWHDNLFCPSAAFTTPANVAHTQSSEAAEASPPAGAEPHSGAAAPSSANTRCGYPNPDLHPNPTPKLTFTFTLALTITLTLTLALIHSPSSGMGPSSAHRLLDLSDLSDPSRSLPNGVPLNVLPPSPQPRPQLKLARGKLPSERQRRPRLRP